MEEHIGIPVGGQSASGYGPKGMDLVILLTRYGKPLDHYRVIPIKEATDFPVNKSCEICAKIKTLCGLNITQDLSVVTFDWHLVGILG